MSELRMHTEHLNLHKTPKLCIPFERQATAENQKVKRF